MEKANVITAYFDFETYNLTEFKFGLEDKKNWDKQLKTEKPIAVYGAGLLVNDKVYTWFGTKAINEFWRKIVELSKSNNKFTLIAHNCGYDFALLNEFWHTNGYSKIKKINAAQTDDDRAWLWARVNVDGVDIVFQDTWIWDRTCSLAYYSDVLGIKEIKKGKLLHYEKWNLHTDSGKIVFYDSEGELTTLDVEAEREYLINDVKLLPLVREYIYNTKKLILKSEFIPDENNWITSFDKINGKITKAGFAKTCFEQCIGDFFHNTYKRPIPEALYYEQLRSYIGGFTAGNRYITAIDIKEPNIISYDVNSLYPSIMAGYLPTGDVLYNPPKDKKYCEWYRIKGTNCYYKEKYSFLDCPIISIKFQEWLAINLKALEEGTIEELGTFIILKEYYDIINEFCVHNLEIVEVLYQEVTDVLAKSIREAYDLRVLVKGTNKYLADSIKLFLNSGYGKFGERTHEKINVWDEKLCCWTKIKAEKADHYTNLLTGLYVCSMARVKLMTAIKSEIENGNIFLYCDTDSLKLIVNNPVKLEVDPDKLGAWKDEGHYNVWRYPLKRKRYYSYNTHTGAEKITCGGFNKAILKDLEYQDKLDFFNPEINTVIIGGKRAKYTGQILDKTDPNYIVPHLNKYGLTKLYEIDISTIGKLENPHRLVYRNKILGKWVMKRLDE